MISEEDGDMTHVVRVPSNSERYVYVDVKHSGNKTAMSQELLGAALFAELVRKRVFKCSGSLR